MIVIKSKNELSLVECKSIHIEDYSQATSTIGGIHTKDLGKICIVEYTEDNYICLGQYSSIEKAKKVLNVIENATRYGIPFDMPKDEEVTNS
jgi:nitrate reductase NapAB chaperone NapD